MKLLPKTSSVKVNLGRGRLVGNTSNDRLPKADALLKAELWTSKELQWVRDILASPPMRVEMHVTDDSIKLDTSTGSSIHLLKNTQMMPRALNSLPLSLCIIDARTMTTEDVNLVISAPGRGRFLDVPVAIIGGVTETEVMKAAVKKAVGAEWTGDERCIEVLTSDGNAHYTCGRKRMQLLFPAGSQGKKVPPFMNIIHAANTTLGWVACFGLLRYLWKESQGRQQEGNMDWVYVLSEDNSLPVLLTQRIETHPSIVYCSFLSAAAGDVAALVSETLKTCSDTLMLDWGPLFMRAQALESLFDAPVEDPPSSGDDDSELEEITAKGTKAAAATKAPRSEESEAPLFFWESSTAVKPRPEDPKQKEKQQKKDKERSKKPMDKEKEKEGKKRRSTDAAEPAEKKKKEKGASSSDLSRRLGAGLSKPH